MEGESSEIKCIRLEEEVKRLQLQYDMAQTLIKTKEDALKFALDLQAIEYERRLELLNHEHERIELLQDTFVSKDTFEGFIAIRDQRADEWGKWRSDKDIEASTLKGRITGYTAALALFFMVAQIVIKWWK